MYQLHLMLLHFPGQINITLHYMKKKPKCNSMAIFFFFLHSLYLLKLSKSSHQVSVFKQSLQLGLFQTN